VNRLRISLVGLGMAVEPHARSLSALGDSIEVVWAARRSAARTAEFAARHLFPVTTDIERALTDPDVEAVLLLTPPSSHLELGLKAIAAGKHLLVEKPVELTAARARTLVEAAAGAGRRLGVVFQHRFRHASRRAAELVGSWVLGSIAGAGVQVPWWRPQSYYDVPGRGTLARDGGGVLMTHAIHTLDLARALVGIEAVTAARVATTSLHRMETEDLAFALVTLASGAPGSIIATTAAYPGRAEQIDVIGSRGTLTLRGEAMEFRAVDGSEERIGTLADDRLGATPMDFPHEAHRDLIADFADAVRRGREPAVSGLDGLATQQLIERILAAARRVLEH
jgi:predicted dehydrogenase